MEFMTVITTTVPDGTDPAEYEERRAAEAVRARELAAAGHLIRLWRPLGEKRSIGLWRAADNEEFGAIMTSLPLSRWMSIDITELESHPNDPGPSDQDVR
jgi:muconolactone D-isomerase